MKSEVLVAEEIITIFVYTGPVKAPSAARDFQ
jgi:hypothetical protein